MPTSTRLSSIARQSGSRAGRLASVASSGSRSILSGIRPPEIEIDQRWGKAFSEQAEMIRQHNQLMMEWWRKISTKLDLEVQAAIDEMAATIQQLSQQVVTQMASMAPAQSSTGSSVSSVTPVITDAQLIDWTNGEVYQILSAAYNDTGHATSATIRWPDGTFGQFVTTTFNPTHMAIDSYYVTHVASGRRVTQNPITRDVDGNVSIKPPLVVT